MGNSGSEKTKNEIKKILDFRQVDWFDLAILHPPYADIIKFSDKKECLSNCESVEDFYKNFWKVLKNTFDLLKKWWYCVIVIWDKYQNSAWSARWFWCMNEAQKVWFLLKSIIVKNMEWIIWKMWSGGIWKYRALNSDYYIFKHEYILVFKK